MNDILKNIIQAVEKKVGEEFDRNFERKAFFNQAWKPSKNGMIKHGDLRRSIQSKISGNSIVFSSSLPYASIHNEGGKIKVTPQMKRYFWAKYLEISGKTKTGKDGAQSQSKRNLRINAEMAQWKILALMKVGSFITMPKRQFIGDHPQVKQAVEKVFADNLKNLDAQIKNMLNKR